MEGSPRTLLVDDRPLAAKVPPRGRVNSFPLARQKLREAIPSLGSSRDRGRSRRQQARARQMPNPLRSNSNRWVAERIRRAIAALKADLMCAVSVREVYPVIL